MSGEDTIANNQEMTISEKQCGCGWNGGGQEKGGPKRLQDSDNFKERDATNASQESGQYWNEEQSMFPCRTIFYEADECGVMPFDSDVMKNHFHRPCPRFGQASLSNDPIYDEAGPSYDSNNPFEVQDHDAFVDHMDEYHEVHEIAKR
ncbi:hypothetical protein Tco_0465360 [Tanacetum coccineum]